MRTLRRRIDEVSQEIVQTTTLGQLVLDATQLTSVADTEEQGATVTVREGDDALEDVAFLISAVRELLLVLKVRTFALGDQKAQLGNGISGQLGLDIGSPTPFPAEGTKVTPLGFVLEPEPGVRGQARGEGERDPTCLVQTDRGPVLGSVQLHAGRPAERVRRPRLQVTSAGCGHD